MVQIQINVDKKVSKEIDIFKAKNGLKNKAKVVEEILKKFFKVKK